MFRLVVKSINQVYHKKLIGSKVGVVFGSFAPLHQGHLDLIMRAKKENDGGCIVVVCGWDGDKGEPLMPLSRRFRYVREFFANDDLVIVRCINDTELGIAQYPYGWEAWHIEFEKLWSISVSEEMDISRAVWYVGDSCYAELLRSENKKAVYVDRKENPITATMIRNNPITNWDKIADPFKRVYSTNILITGTASEGKTTLVQDLGKYFSAPYSHEWARDYIAQSCIGDWEFTGIDFMAFVEGQYRLNKSLINSPANHGIFFADTDAMVSKMYAYYYAKDPEFVLTQGEYEKVAMMADEYAKKSTWDKIYLLKPKHTFVDDGARYMPHGTMIARTDMYDFLCQSIKDIGQGDRVVELEGSYYENFMVISNYVKGIVKNGKGN